MRLLYPLRFTLLFACALACSSSHNSEPTSQYSEALTTVLVGDTTAYSTTDGAGAGTVEAWFYTATASGTLNRLSLCVAPGNLASQIKVGLYASNSGDTRPTTLLTSGVITSPVNGWNTVTVPNATVTSGTKYWVAMLSPVGSGAPVFCYADGSSANKSRDTSATNLSALPSTFPSSGTNYPRATAGFYGSAETGGSGGTGGTAGTGGSAGAGAGGSGGAGSSAGGAGAGSGGAGASSGGAGAGSGGTGGTAAGTGGSAGAGAGAGGSGGAGSSAGGAGAGSGGAAAGTGGSGGSLIFNDDFDAAFPSQWHIGSRPSESLQAFYLSTNLSESAGQLHILSQADASMPGYAYTTGVVQLPFSFLYGTIEVVAKLPGGTGTWPAFWLLGDNCREAHLFHVDDGEDPNCNWPNPGADEVDMVETGTAHPDINQQVHMTGSNFGCNVSVPTATTAFHTYRLIWAPNSLTWQIDGTTTCSTSGSASVPSHKMFLLIQTELGGVFGGSVNPSTLPQSLDVDSVKIWQ
jgi:hypothetical protein